MSHALALLVCVAAAAQSAAPQKKSDRPKRKPAEERVTLEKLVTADRLPLGYAVSSKEVRDGETLLGHRLFVIKEGAVSKVVIGIEERPITTQAEKVAATKAYINGTSEAMAGTGAKLVKKVIPDVEKADFTRPVVADLTYQTPSGGDLFVEVRVFFAKSGYNLQVIADDPDEFEELAKWAASVRPAG